MILLYICATYCCKGYADEGVKGHNVLVKVNVCLRWICSILCLQNTDSNLSSIALLSLSLPCSATPLIMMFIRLFSAFTSFICSCHPPIWWIFARVCGGYSCGRRILCWNRRAAQPMLLLLSSAGLLTSLLHTANSNKVTETILWPS